MKRAPRVSHWGSLGAQGSSRHFSRAPHATLEAPRWRQGPFGGVNSPHEGPTPFRMILRIPRDPHKFIVALLAIDILSRDRFKEEIASPIPMVSFSRAHYRISFVGCLPEGPTSWRGPLARGAYQLEGPTGQRGLQASRGHDPGPPLALRSCAQQTSEMWVLAF